MREAGAEAGGRRAGRGGDALSSSPTLSWGHVLCFCRGGNLVLQAGVRGTSWTQSPLEPRAFPGPPGPPGDAVFMEAVHCPGCCFTLPGNHSAPASSPLTLLAFREAGPPVFLVMALRDTACNCWGCSQGPPTPPGCPKTTIMLQLLFGDERTSADKKSLANMKGPSSLGVECSQETELASRPDGCGRKGTLRVPSLELVGVVMGGNKGSAAPAPPSSHCG